MAEEPGEAYQSLYRRYRPQRFAEVRGQEHVTTALRNAVRQERVAHAYLFSGPRGTGKTSTARILAMALNCENPADGEPDGTCPSCVAIRRGSSVDVHELDAASNRRLDEMRDLLSRVSLGTRGRWKVYIVDEVHQLTPDAASALLKTLEEPPAHVVFVLATTDPQKVLPTIRSRTQHFEFRLLGSATLEALLADVNADAGLGVAPEAIDLVVARGRGSARDALSVLDQVAAAGGVEEEASVVADIVDALGERDPGRALVAVGEAMAAGRDPRRLAVDLIEHLRNGFLALTARGLVQLSDDAAAAAEAQARRLGTAAVVRAMELVGEAAAEMRDSVDPRVTLEVALVRLAAPAADTDPAALAARLERIEAQLAGGAQLRAGAAEEAPRPAPRSEPAPDAPAPAETPGPPRPPRRAAPPEPRGAPTRPGDSRRSLGAPPPVPAPPPSGRPAASPPSPRPPGPARATIGAHRRSGPEGAGTAPGPDRRDPAPAPRPADPAPRGHGEGGVPSRDELTKAWGDSVLPGLPARVKAYLAQGRFVAVEGGKAVFALPDRGLLGRAEGLRPEVERALAGHFGRPVPLRLTLDDGAAPARDDGPSSEEGDYDLEDLADAPPGVTSPEQRLLEAFPGAEEVTP